MSEYVCKVTLEVNGSAITDFSSVSEGEVELAKQVNLMNKTGHISITPRYTVQVDYVVPLTGAFDWTTVKDGRLTIENEGGGRTTYTGVYTTKIGEAKADGDKEMTKNITLGAEARKEE